MTKQYCTLGIGIAIGSTTKIICCLCSNGQSPSWFSFDPSGPAGSPPQGSRPLVSTGVPKTQRLDFDPTLFPPFSADPRFMPQIQQRFNKFYIPTAPATT